MLTFTVLCQFFHFQPWIRDCLEDLWKITQMSTSQGVEHVPRGGERGTRSTLLSVTPNGIKAPQLYVPLCLTLLPGVVVTVVKNYPVESIIMLVRCCRRKLASLPQWTACWEQAPIRGTDTLSHQQKLFSKHLAISQNCLTNTLPSLKIIYC
jgi:hypothetical protein